MARFNRSEALPAPSPHLVRSRRRKTLVASRAREGWAASYGPLLASQLEVGRRYSLLRIGAAEFAYTRYDQLAQALARAWELGLVPELLPSAFGRDLPQAAPWLRGVDSDLGGCDPAEFAGPLPAV